ncbi:hypothetical protein DENSPDRAFT_533969 [Dentipellis sp. KUC8613]|nr:hypothetical protein DENSPDRAFT_533969 [Dentipellis sp. KUC8613]
MATSNGPLHALHLRRPNKCPKGSLPTYSRPKTYRLQTPPHALRTRSLLKDKPHGKGAEGVLLRRCGVDDETKRVLTWSAEVCQESREAVRDSRAFSSTLVEYGHYADQRIKELKQDITEDTRGLQKSEDVRRGSSRSRRDNREEIGNAPQIASEFKRDMKTKTERLHQSMVAYRNLRREGRRAGLR